MQPVLDAPSGSKRIESIPNRTRGHGQQFTSGLSALGLRRHGRSTLAVLGLRERREVLLNSNHARDVWEYKHTYEHASPDRKQYGLFELKHGGSGDIV